MIKSFLPALVSAASPPAATPAIALPKKAAQHQGLKVHYQQPRMGFLDENIFMKHPLFNISLLAFAISTAATALAQQEQQPLKKLNTVKVNADALDSTATEGTGSYTTDASNSAVGLNLSLRETPQSVTVITRDRIEDQGLENITEVLDQTVGVTFNGTSGLGSDGISFYARGFDIKNFQIDGTPRPPAIYGFLETTTDMALYDRVEIVRGANGLMSGAGSPAASINLIRKRPTVENVVSISTQVGSYDHYRLEADASGALTASGNVRGRVVASYQENDSFVDRVHINKELVYGILEADLTEHTLLTLGAEYQDFTNRGASRGGLPLFYKDGLQTDFLRSTNTGAEWSDFNRQTTRLFTSLQHQFNDDWSVKLEAEESRPYYDEIIGYMYSSGFDPANSNGATIFSARWAGDLKQQIVSLSASGSFSLWGRSHELRAGISHNTAEDQGDNYSGWWSSKPGYRVSLSNIWDFFASGNATKPDLDALGSRYGGRVEQEGAYIATRLKPADSLSIILGSRISDWRETEWDASQPLTHETGVVTPYAGVMFDFTENYSLYASYTNIFEPQTAVDINWQRLPALEGNTYEAGVKGELNEGRLNITAAVFRIEQDNFAVAIPDAEANDKGKIPSTAEKGTVSKGFELEVAGEVARGWQLGGGYSQAKPKDSEGKPMLTEVATESFKLFSSYKLSGEWQDLTLGGNLRWQDSSYSEGSSPTGGDYQQASLTLVDLMTKYAVTEKLSLTLNANNIFDKEYYSGFTWATGVYGAPRNFMLTAKYQF